MSHTGIDDFIPSSIRDQSLKVINSFQQHINLKIEPTIYSDWCRKPGKKRKTVISQIRFCVVTPAALYICKLGHKSTTKLSQIFHWASIMSFKSDIDMHDVAFKFRTGSIFLLFEQVDQFVKKVLTHLKTILPDYYHIEYCIMPNIETPIDTIRPSKILDLFLSKCKALGENVDPQFLINFKHKLSHKYSITIDSSQFNDAKIDAICFALSYSPYMKKLKIGGKNFDGLFHQLASIISLNFGIKRIEIFKHKTDCGLDSFLEKLQKSKVNKLVFSEVTFNQSNADVFMEKINELPLQTLSFSRSQFGKTLLPFFKRPLSESISQFIIQNDVIQKEQIEPLIKFSLTSNLSSLTITDCNIDISHVFSVFPTTSKITKIDLSGNMCGKDFTGTYSIPSTMKKIILQRITWEGDSLAIFLSKQVYLDRIELDLSSAYLTGEQIIAFKKSLPENPTSPNIINLAWNNNPIFQKFLNFISKFTYLQQLTLDNCETPLNEKKAFLHILSTLISSTNLQHFSISNTFREYGTKLMITLRDVLCEHQTLNSICVSDNSIGDEGLIILKEIVTINTRIRSISFDGCNVQNYQTLAVFLSEVSQLPYLKHISKPRKEFARLGEIYGKRASRELKNAWICITETRSQNDDNESESDNHNIQSDHSTTSTTSALISNTVDTTESQLVMTRLEVDWDPNIELDYDGSAKEWKSLNEQFSYANITGIDVLKTKDA